MSIAALIVAAGRGTRAAGPGGGPPKQYRMLAGAPVLQHVIGVFSTYPDISRIVVVIHRNDRAMFDELARRGDMAVEAVPGGDTRQESVLNGLHALKAYGPRDVLIHDGARPLIGHGLISRVSEGLKAAQAVLPVIPVAETPKRVINGAVSETLGRDGLVLAQTPQGFRYDSICSAHEQALAAGLNSFTDDAAIAEWAGMEVQVVEGDPDNMKLTTENDFARAESLLAWRETALQGDVRTGTGFDVHAFADGDHVMLCGVRIGHDRALSGHSDADVGLHALTDAILGAIGAGDIGSHFPPSDPKWRGAPSDIFLLRAAELVKERGGAIAHCDVTLICERPKIGPHVAAMRARVGEIVGISADRVSVKATTTERLGFAGRGEGIAAQAVATVRLPWKPD